MVKLLREIFEGAKTAVKNPVQSFLQGAAAITPILAHPVTLATKGYEAAKDQTYASSLGTNIRNILGTGAVAAVGTLAVGTSAGLAATASAARSVGAISLKHPKLAATAVVGGPIAVGVLTSSSKAREVVISAPSSLNQLGKDIGQTIENPSLSNVVDLIKQHPVASAVAVGAAGLATATTVNSVATALNTRATNKDNEIAVNIPQAPPQTIVVQQAAPSIPNAVPVAAPSGVPGAAPPKKKKKKSSVKKKKKAKPRKRKRKSSVKKKSLNTRKRSRKRKKRKK